MSKYRLYIGPLQEIPQGVEYSYYDSNRRRMFVLSEDQPRGSFVPVPNELLPKMDPGERRWFNESCFAINQKWLGEHQTEAAEAANALLDRFEEELRAEAEKIKEKDDGGEEEETAE